MVKLSSTCGASACFLLVGQALIGPAQADASGLPSWTGFYVGAHIGNAVSESTWKDAADLPPVLEPFSGSFTGGGIVRGAQAGYNHQIGDLVLGIEGEGSFADIDGGAQCARAHFACNTKVEALAALTARLGYAFGDFLVYGKAGGGLAYEKLTMTPNPGTLWSDPWQSRHVRTGVALGAGVEYALSSAVSAKIEYNYLGFGNGWLDVVNAGGARANVELDQSVHLIKLGLNTKLTGAPLTRSVTSAGLPAQIWNGAYVGVHTGGTWGTTEWTSATGSLAAASSFGFPGTGTMDGMIAGAQIGFNRQIGAAVFGGEIDASWSNLDGFAKCATGEVNGVTGNFACHSHIDALGTFAGRLGWAHDNFLIYGKAGAAWASERLQAARNDLPNSFTGSSLRWGYVLGSGVEYAFSPAWSGKLEYNYLDFGTKTVDLTDQFGNASSVGAAQRAHLVRMGLNYHLGASPRSTAFNDNLAFKSARRPGDWTIEVGTRYWYSNGRMQKDLSDATGVGRLNSRLVYSGMDGHAAESFVRLDHRSGLFVKGNFGLGSLVNGKLNDEDFTPENDRYSNTVHDVRDSSLRYASLDIGTTVVNGSSGWLGAYAGYRYLYQRARGFGCTQIGQSPDACGTPASNEVVGLSETEQWRGVAVGLNAQIGLSDRLKLEIDAAYLPYVDHATVDNHWFRPDINPAPAPGHGWGTQLEAILSYAVTDHFNVGIGGRYWMFTTTEADTRFPGFAEISPLKYTSERYGGFLQASYRFGGSAVRRDAAGTEAPATNWTGPYIGGHIGAGFGRSNWSDPFPPPPTGDRVNVGGALGGVQVGVNYQVGQIVAGVEIAGSLSQLEGTETCFGGNPLPFAGVNCENATRNLAMLTGRLGYATGQNLFYVKAGGVLARETYALNFGGVPEGTLTTRSATTPGWIAGAGIEHALTSNWSVNAEYKYLDFGTRSIDFVAPELMSAVSSEPVKTSRHLLTLGVNYRFGH